MVNALDIEKRAELQKFGFTARMVGGSGMMLEGFDSHLITLYCHTDNPSQLPTIPMRIGNPAQIDNAEADLLMRKMKAGYFPWAKEECLDRTFHLEWNTAEERNGMVVPTGKVKGPDQQGCKWCRERSESGLPGEAVSATPEPAQEAVSVESSVSQPDPAPPKVNLEDVVCDQCGWISPEVAKSGKPRSAKQRAHGLTMHKRSHPD